MTEVDFNSISEKLFVALKGINTDEKTVISMFASLTNEQIVRQLLPAFKQSKGKDLPEMLKAKTSGDFRDLLTLMVTPRYDNWAKVLEETSKNKKSLVTFTRLISLMDHQDKIRIVQSYKSLFAQTVDVLAAKVSDEVVRQYAQSMLLNEYQITEPAVEAFCQHCQGQVTREQLFQMLATLTPQLTQKFMIRFKEVKQEDFTVYIEKNFAEAVDVIKTHLRGLENPVKIVADLINVCIKGLGTDENLMNYLTSIFRDYCWKDLAVVYKQYGDVVADLKGDLSGDYEQAVLRFWGLAWF